MGRKLKEFTTREYVSVAGMHTRAVTADKGDSQSSYASVGSLTLLDGLGVLVERPNHPSGIVAMGQIATLTPEDPEDFRLAAPNKAAAKIKAMKAAKKR